MEYMEDHGQSLINRYKEVFAGFSPSSVAQVLNKTGNFSASDDIDVNSTIADIFKNLSHQLSGTKLCGVYDNRENVIVQRFAFWGSGVTISTIGGIGLIGNLLSFATIITMKKRHMFNNLLLTLTLFDILFIINGGSSFVQMAFNFNNYLYNILFPKVLYPLSAISMTGSTYTCVAIALERCLGICYSQSDFQIRRSRYYILTIVLVSIIIDFPRFFEISNTVVISNNGSSVAFAYTDIRKNYTYITFYTLWFRLLSTAAIPFMLTLFFNLKIFLYYKRNSFTFGRHGGTPSRHQITQRQQSSSQTILKQSSTCTTNVTNLTNIASSSGTSNSSSQERSLFVTFFCLTITFLICHLPRILLNINELQNNKQNQICQSQYQRPFREHTWVLIAHSIEKILLILNSSINFAYYCLAGKTFRQHMCKQFFGWSGWCLKVVTGIDPTTTAGTGETTVPDIESRVDVSIRSSKRLRSQVSIDFSSSHMRDIAQEFHDIHGSTMFRKDNLAIIGGLRKAQLIRQKSGDLKSLKEDSNEDHQASPSKEVQVTIEQVNKSSSILHVNMDPCRSEDDSTIFSTQMPRSSSSSGGYYEINITIQGQKSKTNSKSFANISSPSTGLSYGSVPNLTYVSSMRGWRLSQDKKAAKKFSPRALSISPTGSYKEEGCSSVFV